MGGGVGRHAFILFCSDLSVFMCMYMCVIFIKVTFSLHAALNAKMSKSTKIALSVLHFLEKGKKSVNYQ